MTYIDKKKLELKLSSLNNIKNPKIWLEQYQTPPNIASFLIYRAALDDEINDKIVADLGAGNGILGIGAKLMGAKKVYSVEVDRDSAEICKQNAKYLGIELECVEKDVRDFNVKVDTVLMNPPFGSRIENLDIPFLNWAIENSNVFYTFMNGKSGTFPEKFMNGKAKIEWIITIPFELKRSYDFHKRERINMPSYILKARTCQKT